MKSIFSCQVIDRDVVGAVPYKLFRPVTYMVGKQKNGFHKVKSDLSSAVTHLASIRGFEPPAYRLGGGRSIQLSYMDTFIKADSLMSALIYLSKLCSVLNC